MGQHRLSGSRLSLEQQRHLKGHGDIDDLGKLLIQDIPCSTGKFCQRIISSHSNAPYFLNFLSRTIQKKYYKSSYGLFPKKVLTVFEIQDTAKKSNHSVRMCNI